VFRHVGFFSVRSRMSEAIGADTGNDRRKTREPMTTEAKKVRFRKQMAKLEASRRTPDKVKMPPREKIRIKRRCKLCGRARAVYRKFGICRICFRGLASDGLIPGVQKASW
jgi:small subunit ribosomal protein S14